MGLFGKSKNEVNLENENMQLKAEINRLSQMLSPEQREIQYLQEQITTLKQSLSSNAAEVNNLFNRKKELNEDIGKLLNEADLKRKELSIFDNDLNALEYGLYKPTFEFATSDLYKDELKKLRDKQKEYIKKDIAVLGDNGWTVNGSEAKGRAMIKDYKKLLLRAFNVECDDIVSKVKISNYDKSIERIEKISEQISKLGKSMSISINKSYMRLKMDEVGLALDYQEKKQEEKEIQKELRAKEREEAKVLKEIEEERKRLQKEQNHYNNALKTVLSQIEKYGESEELLNKKAELEAQMEEIKTAIVDVDYREANRKAGYVYVISNIGAFGENVYKIGMTRRLDPQERIDELGDASVPFNFDKHAIIFTEDAPALEAALHNAFESKKLNKINTRREFFAVTLDEIKEEVRRNFDKTVEWIDIPEADQYRQSQLMK